MVGGGLPAGARAAAAQAIAGGATALLSFGLAGGLDPALRPGALVVPRFVRRQGDSFEADPGLVAWLGGPTQQVLLGGASIAATRTEKAALWQRFGASAIDLESGEVADAAVQAGLPFAVLRAVCDPASRDLPPAALIPLRSGRVALGPILMSVLRHPRQIGPMMALGRDAAAAKTALAMRVRAIGRDAPG